MATITGLTAARMLEIEGSSVVDGEIVAGNLILTKHDGTTIDAGPLPPGPAGPIGPAGGQIPGEIKMWPGSVLPDSGSYGNWVWADGATYDVALYPEAAANIAVEWRTFAGASDPAASLFRVPDLRGLVPAGMDGMPLGTRANRVTRAIAIVLAGKTGEETHVITIPEMPPHGHTITDPGHTHPNTTLAGPLDSATGGDYAAGYPTGPTGIGYTGITINNNGGGGAHENLQPTVFVPYIVKLDD